MDISDEIVKIEVGLIDAEGWLSEGMFLDGANVGTLQALDHSLLLLLTEINFSSCRQFLIDLYIIFFTRSIAMLILSTFYYQLL